MVKQYGMHLNRPYKKKHLKEREHVQTKLYATLPESTETTNFQKEETYINARLPPEHTHIVKHLQLPSSPLISTWNNGQLQARHETTPVTHVRLLENN